MRASLIAVTMMAAFAVQARAECTAPQAPGKMPDGATATQEEMVAGVKGVKQYNADVTAYGECLDRETKDMVAALGAPTRESEAKAVQIKNAQAKRQNAVVDDVQAYAAKFNEQIRAFKARQPKQ